MFGMVNKTSNRLVNSGQSNCSAMRNKVTLGPSATHSMNRSVALSKRGDARYPSVRQVGIDWAER